MHKPNAYIFLLLNKNDEVVSLGSILPYYLDFFPTVWLQYNNTVLLYKFTFLNYNFCRQFAY